MSSVTILIALIALIFGVLKLLPKLVKWQEMSNIVNQIPGPKTYPFIGTTWLAFGIPRNKIFSELQKTWKLYPHIQRSWVGIYPEIHIAKAEYVEKIMSTTKHMEKSYVYEFIKPWLGDGLLISKGEKWHHHRKIITPTFHFSILDGFCDVFAEQSAIMVKKLEAHADTGRAVDVYPFVTRCALDIIAETAMGTKINAQDGANSDYVSAIYEISELAIKRLFRPWLHTDFIYQYTEDGKRYAKDLQTLHNFTWNVIEERREKRIAEKKLSRSVSVEDDVGKKKRLAFLDLLMNASEGDQKLTLDDLRQEVDTFMFEGHDTTSSGISWTLFCIGNNPDIQLSIHEELDAIFGVSDREATIQDLSDMPYLERVIKETMRLYPPVPFIGRISSEDVEVAGYKIPKGCYIGIEIFNIMRDPDHFPNPEQFDPDRFLPENSKHRHPYAYIPFSAGPRNCIGQKFAFLEEKAVVSSVLRKFRLRSADKPEDINLVSELIMRTDDGLKIYLEKR